MIIMKAQLLHPSDAQLEVMHAMGSVWYAYMLMKAHVYTTSLMHIWR